MFAPQDLPAISFRDGLGLLLGTLLSLPDCRTCAVVGGSVGQGSYETQQETSTLES